MELYRKKNTDTRILFPIVDADGDFVSSAAGLDSEWISYDTADHGAGAPSFSDCTHEATEIGSTGVYYLDVSAAEINKDFTLIQIKTSTSGAKTQCILIQTLLETQVAAIDTVVDTIQADTDLLDDAAGGIADIHTDVAAVKSETASIYAAVVTNAAGADVAADIIAIKGVVDTIQADTDLLDDAAGGLADIHTDIGSVKTETALIYAAVVTNAAGADVAADIIAVKADTAAIKLLTDHLPDAEPGAPGGLPSCNLLGEIEQYVNISRPSAAVVDNAANTSSYFKTSLTSTKDDYLKDAYLKFWSGVNINQVKKVLAYDGTDKFITTEAFTDEPGEDPFVLIVE